MGRYPEHPWIGEAVPLDWANPVAGAPFTDFGESMRYRVRDDGFSTVSAGDAFIAGFFDWRYLLPGDPVVASFVIVCTGTGTLRLSGGVDPDWALDDPADASTPLGTHVVDGPTTVVGMLPTFDVDAYLDQLAETIVHVECMSGVIDITQVKLRLWPPTGPVGGWKTADSFTRTAPVESDNVGMLEGSQSTANFTNSDPGQAFQDANAELVNIVTDDDLRGVDPADQVPQSMVTASAIAQVQVTRLSSPEVYTAFGQFVFGGSILQQVDPVNQARLVTPNYEIGEAGLDYAWPPDEVTGDFAVQLLGTPTVAWGEFTVETGISFPLNDFWEASICATVIPDEARQDIGSITFPPGPGSMLFPLPPETTTLDLPDARTVLVSLSHRILTEMRDYLGPGTFPPGGAWGVGALGIFLEGALVSSTVTIPPYRYWDPTGTRESILRHWPREDGRGGTPTMHGPNRMSRLATHNPVAYD